MGYKYHTYHVCQECGASIGRTEWREPPPGPSFSTCTDCLKKERTVPLLPYQERVIEEQIDLDEKIMKLRVFIGSPAFNAVYAAEQDRMQQQLGAMSTYSFILGERIAAFGDK